jgi:hypothetical protein
LTFSSFLLIQFVSCCDYRPNLLPPIDVDRAKEYRKNPRKTYLKTTYFISENKYYKGAIKNISRRGAFIESKAKFLSGDQFKIVVPGTKKYILLKGEIVHFNPAGFGVEFKRLLKIKKIPENKNTAPL